MCFRRRVRHQISILVPFGGEDPGRLETLKWLLAYYRAQLPKAEIVLGRDRVSKRTWRNRQPKPFSKAVALNNAFKKSHGDIIVLLDADAILADGIIQHCADRLRKQREAHVRSWFIPYNKLFRLTRKATMRILASDPRRPLVLWDPPPPQDIEGHDGSGPINTFGAMCQIMPHEAFMIVHGFDERHRGWALRITIWCWRLTNCGVISKQRPTTFFTYGTLVSWLVMVRLGRCGCGQINWSHK